MTECNYSRSQGGAFGRIRLVTWRYATYSMWRGVYRPNAPIFATASVLNIALKTLSHKRKVSYSRTVAML